MPTTETFTLTKYANDENGVAQFVETVSIEVEVPTLQEEIADKEAALLAMYEELQTLKNQQSN